MLPAIDMSNCEQILATISLASDLSVLRVDRCLDFR
jgi:hypothetical protein